MGFSRRRGIIGVVTDRRRLRPGGSPEAQFAAIVAQASGASAAGVDFLQIRERDLPARDLLALVRDVLDAVSGSGMHVLVNDRLDVALAAGAHGVHLPGAGLPPSGVRALAPGDFLIGQSIHGSDSPAPGADFAVFGTLFQTTSKEPGHRIAGMEALASAVRATTVPVLAIGGIDETTIEEVAAVCGGVAAIGWFATTDPHQLFETVRRARRAFDTTPPNI